ncbi:hypothetical protein PENSPDRAFT_512993 [Peniophora sp. CONT]|nr:hypothetical protein PENSPDRAFT_512993 [Peniophora sp. CONT]
MSVGQNSRKRATGLVLMSLAFLSLAAFTLWSTRSVSQPMKSLLSFSVPFGDPVAMTITNSARYKMEGEESVREWAGLVPRGGHTVQVALPGDPVPTTYTVTLFHQMKCLDLLREDMMRIVTARAEPSAFTSHCMNYLRQTILCRPNLRLESVKNVRGSAIRTYDAVCNDWTRVYQEADRNHAAFEAWQNSSLSG